MRKGNRFGPGVLRMMLALFVLGVIAVFVREMPGLRRYGRGEPR
ncbi:hypothetical protein ACN3XK_53280 [Actinomadura welshii]